MSYYIALLLVWCHYYIISCCFFSHVMAQKLVCLCSAQERDVRCSGSDRNCGVWQRTLSWTSSPLCSNWNVSSPRTYAQVHTVLLVTWALKSWKGQRFMLADTLLWSQAALAEIDCTCFFFFLLYYYQSILLNHHKMKN